MRPAQASQPVAQLVARRAEKALLEIASGCRSCRAGRGCGLALTQSRQHLWVPDRPSWRLGQHVTLTPPMPLRHMALRAYGPPLAGLLAGASLGALACQAAGLAGALADLAMALGAALGVGAAFFYRRVQHRSVPACSAAGEGSLK
ncbi:MAG: SoxR reducing system RseC family protein [Pseudomonadota bacterium]